LLILLFSVPLALGGSFASTITLVHKTMAAQGGKQDVIDVMQLLDQSRDALSRLVPKLDYVNIDRDHFRESIQKTLEDLKRIRSNLGLARFDNALVGSGETTAASDGDGGEEIGRLRKRQEELDAGYVNWMTNRMVEAEKKMAKVNKDWKGLTDELFDIALLGSVGRQKNSVVEDEVQVVCVRKRIAPADASVVESTPSRGEKRMKNEKG